MKPRWGSVLLGAVCGAVVTYAALYAVDRGRGLAAAFDEGITITYLGTTIDWYAAETMMLRSLLEPQLAAADREEIIAKIEARGWSWFDKPQDSAIYASARPGQIGFVFEGEGFAGLTGQCEALGMPENCDLDGGTDHAD